MKKLVDEDESLDFVLLHFLHFGRSGATAALQLSETPVQKIFSRFFFFMSVCNITPYQNTTNIVPRENAPLGERYSISRKLGPQVVLLRAIYVKTY